MKKFSKVLVANRGEIALRVLRACQELGLRTVAIYSKEDQCALFRTRANESYLIGRNKGPIEAYLNIEEIIELALKKGVDAIHPGYGFLAENPDFARQCEEAGITFIGPSPSIMEKMGDKLQSKLVAKSVGVPIIPGSDGPITSEEEAIRLGRQCGYPIILKASAGGGGRGMRIVREEKALRAAFHRARNEAKKAFGIEDIFIEKYLERPKHIEVQILGDHYGDIIHLYERDCSIQRRHQKLIEFSPAFSISEAKRKMIYGDALKIAKAVHYKNAGTIEFLVDGYGNHYFIEMNPRIQVEHTVTEMVTGIDLVQSQILVAEGYPLKSKAIHIYGQQDIKPRGYAIQCRITTEDPTNGFAPDTGKIDVYRTASGFGIRLDGGNGFTGAIISPYYDSLLVKTTAWSRNFEDAIRKATRAIKENVISGIKTNSDFLINVLNHPTFLNGACHTHFIEEHPQLFDITPMKDDELRILMYIGDKIVNETQGEKRHYDVPKIPKVEQLSNLKGTKHLLDEQGPEALVTWIKRQNKLLLTDTTMRDAHQSLMATRMRTRDMTRVARPTSVLGKDLFSLEVWGGTTFDVAYRFLKESPWERLKKLRKGIPNILFQMLLRGSNGVGYKNYPDNVIREFVKQAADEGIDIFRIFDSLNWLKGMAVSVDEVLKQNKVAEVCMCYTGDILDKRRDKYTLDYYVKLAKEIEKMGAHILGIKDMSALLKPYGAYKLIKALKNEISIPIHLHTHDTSGNGVATLLMATEAGVDIVDTAFNSMSGLTSQPPLDSIVAALENTWRDTGISIEDIEKISDYWRGIRMVYDRFESDLKSGTTEIYKYEIPGGQYSNLKPQVESFGLGHRFHEVKEMYQQVNVMLGDIIKVTPSSKAVGDLAVFMVQNNLTPKTIYEKEQEMAFPDSVVAYFKGMMGQPMGGFPKALQKIVLKNEEPITCRPGELLPSTDFEEKKAYLHRKFDFHADKKDLLSHALYPKVFEDYLEFRDTHGDLSNMPSDIFFYGLREGEVREIKVHEGKVLVVKFIGVGKREQGGYRFVTFEVNGNRREIKIKDKTKSITVPEDVVQMADENNPLEIGANIPGKVLQVLVEADDKVLKGDPLVIIEAMKMETTIRAQHSGKVKSIPIKEGQMVQVGELLMKLT